jgi:hypothetical protein
MQMATIIAGGFGTEVQAQVTVRQLLNADVPLDDICSLRVGSPGEPARGGAVRPAESLVAVNVGGDGRDAKAIAAIFRVCGAQQIERAEGRWANGVWADFDPTAAPHLIGGRDLRRGRRESARAQR